MRRNHLSVFPWTDQDDTGLSRLVPSLKHRPKSWQTLKPRSLQLSPPSAVAGTTCKASVSSLRKVPLYQFGRVNLVPEKARAGMAPLLKMMRAKMMRRQRHRKFPAKRKYPRPSSLLIGGKTRQQLKLLRSSYSPEMIVSRDRGAMRTIYQTMPRSRVGRSWSAQHKISIRDGIGEIGGYGICVVGLFTTSIAEVKASG